MYSRKRIETIRKMKCHMIISQLEIQKHLAEESRKLPPIYYSEDNNLRSCAESHGLAPLTNVYLVSSADGETPDFHEVYSKIYTRAVLKYGLVPEAIGWFKGGYDNGFYVQGFAAKN
jgi:hypothetical protein